MAASGHSSKPQQSLVKKLTRLNLMVLCGAMLISFLLIAMVLWLTARERQAEAAELAAMQLGNNIASMLVFNDLSAAEQELNLVVSQRDISELLLWDSQGKLFTKASDLTSTQLPVINFRSVKEVQRSFNGLYIQMYVPVVVQDKLEGVIFYQERLHKMLGWFFQGLAILSVIMLAIFLIASRLLIRIQKQALLPLVELAEVAEQVAVARNYGLRAAVHADDEIGRLTLRFNELLKRTEIWQSELSDKLSQQQQQGEVLKELVNRDSLTGLSNRLHFEQLIQQMVQLSVQQEQLAALVFIDLDNFKYVNDNFGHDAGDAVLIEVSRRICAIIRTNDNLCRLGGDEFALLLTSLNSISDATVLCERILLGIRQPLFVQGQIMPIGLSIGVAFSPNDSIDAAQLLQYADSAMYQAKRAGKNDYKLYSPL